MNIHRVLTALCCIALSTTAMTAPIEKTIDETFAEFAKPGVPGAAVMVIKDGKPVFAKAYGSTDLETHVPCSTNTNFRLASVSKQFTAMAVLILAEKGKFELHDRLTKFFTDLPECNKRITIHQLLTHTSGIVDYEDHIPEGTTLPLSDHNVLTIVRQQDTTYFEPGTQFRYSNSGYALLALLVEKVSGQTFPAFLKANIFDPLGMTNTVAYVAGQSSIPNRAFGYAKTGDEFAFSDQSVTSAILGDGGIYSSVVDLFKWDQALYTEKLVSRKMLDKAFIAHSRKSDFEGSGYGYGWFIGEKEGKSYPWHYGSTCGFSTKIERYPAQKLTVIVLANRRDAKLTPLVDKVTSLFW
jgi:CubicO group peptidase (beta-lactamase class C family)